MLISRDGGPAFPVEVTHQHDGTITGLQTGDRTWWAEGLSVRDWFAGMAIQSLRGGDFETFRDMAHDAYMIADAMLKVREMK